MLLLVLLAVIATAPAMWAQIALTASTTSAAQNGAPAQSFERLSTKLEERCEFRSR